MTKYEGLYIIDARVAEEKRNALIEKFAKMAGSDVVVDKWGVKKLAYQINKQSQGFYVLMTFSADNTTVEKIVKLMNITDSIVRKMFIKLDEKKIAVKKVAKTRAPKVEAEKTAEAKEVKETKKPKKEQE